MLRLRGIPQRWKGLKGRLYHGQGSLLVSRYTWPKGTAPAVANVTVKTTVAAPHCRQGPPLYPHESAAPAIARDFSPQGHEPPDQDHQSMGGYRHLIPSGSALRRCTPAGIRSAQRVRQGVYTRGAPIFQWGTSLSPHQFGRSAPSTKGSGMTFPPGGAPLALLAESTGLPHPSVSRHWVRV